jgi:hypothetical protein
VKEGHYAKVSKSTVCRIARGRGVSLRPRMDRYIVFKQTGTHADVLAAVGGADVLRHLEPRIVNFEDRFEIQIRKRLLPSDLDAVDPGFSYLLRPKKTAPSLPPERIIQTRAADIPGASVAKNRMYSILGRMKVFAGPNQVVSCFARMKREEWTSRVWEGFQGSPAFVGISPLVQLFNPHAAKGYSLFKPSGTTRSDKTKDRWAEPFLEWLRFRGYFEGAAGWFASGDLRLFCPVPADVPHGQFVATVAAFRDLKPGGTAAKMDCRAMLGLTRLLIQKAERYRRPNQSMRGVWVTHYKDISQARTLMAMEQMAIPDWFELRTSQRAEWWLQTLEEHDILLRRLTDSHGRIRSAKAVSTHIPDPMAGLDCGVCGIPRRLRSTFVQETLAGSLAASSVPHRRRHSYFETRSEPSNAAAEPGVCNHCRRGP